MFSFNRKTFLIFSGYILLTVFCVKWVSTAHSAHLEKRDDLTTLTRAKSDMELLLTRRAEMEDARRGLVRLTGNYEDLFASDNGRSRILFILNRLSRQSGVQMRSIQPQSEISTPFFSKWPLVLNVEGSYADIVEFTSRVEQAEALMGVAGLEIRRLPKNKDRLSASITLLAFLRQETSAS